MSARCSHPPPSPRLNLSTACEEPALCGTQSRGAGGLSSSGPSVQRQRAFPSSRRAWELRDSLISASRCLSQRYAARDARTRTNKKKRTATERGAPSRATRGHVPNRNPRHGRSRIPLTSPCGPALAGQAWRARRRVFHARTMHTRSCRLFITSLAPIRRRASPWTRRLLQKRGAVRVARRWCEPGLGHLPCHTFVALLAWRAWRETRRELESLSG
ncbi:hypothetical protein L227DRAFT_248552 [Lentinus tigrinus ALCF2SS1-6]|uniref:Uncharacterized protein n=1 Tax=Lentinus tigrinus ALCF2SS1-6 TaxID=1328759 RepID=A0A5C2RZX6_9APHY|nr:hypothetical protein L227DRAFT_248552 [Lentinus tigrinus ALCF2SS1-6]